MRLMSVQYTLAASGLEVLCVQRCHPADLSFTLGLFELLLFVRACQAVRTSSLPDNKAFPQTTAAHSMFSHSWQPLDVFVT